MKPMDAILHPDAHPFRHMAWLLAGLALAAAPHASRFSWWITACTVLVFGWRLYLAWRDRPLPPRWLLFTLAGLATAGVWLTFRTTASVSFSGSDSSAASFGSFSYWLRSGRFVCAGR